MADFLLDTFTGSGDLDTHVGELGATWTQVYGGSLSAMVVSGGQLSSTSTSSIEFQTFPTIPTVGTEINLELLLNRNGGDHSTNGFAFGFFDSETNFAGPIAHFFFSDYWGTGNVSCGVYLESIDPYVNSTGTYYSRTAQNTDFKLTLNVSSDRKTFTIYVDGQYLIHITGTYAGIDFTTIYVKYKQISSNELLLKNIRGYSGLPDDVAVSDPSPGTGEFYLDTFTGSIQTLAGHAGEVGANYRLRRSNQGYNLMYHELSGTGLVSSTLDGNDPIFSSTAVVPVGEELNFEVSIKRQTTSTSTNQVYVGFDQGPFQALGDNAYAVIKYRHDDVASYALIETKYPSVTSPEVTLNEAIGQESVLTLNVSPDRKTYRIYYGGVSVSEVVLGTAKTFNILYFFWRTSDANDIEISKLRAYTGPPGAGNTPPSDHSISSSYINFCLSGGGGNADISESLGGPLSLSTISAQYPTFTASIPGIEIVSMYGITAGTALMRYDPATFKTSLRDPSEPSYQDGVITTEDGIYELKSSLNQTVIIRVTASLLPSVLTVAQFTASLKRNNLFDRVRYSEALAGRVEYRCFYLRNTHPTGIVKFFGLYAEAQPVVGTYTWGFDPSGVGDGVVTGVAQLIADETTAPVDVTFSSPTTALSSTLSPSNIGPGQSVAVWIKRTIAPSSAINDNLYTLDLSLRIAL